MHLEKWYADWVDHFGQPHILYLARLRMGPVSLGYSARLGQQWQARARMLWRDKQMRCHVWMRKPCTGRWWATAICNGARLIGPACTFCGSSKPAAWCGNLLFATAGCTRKTANALAGGMWSAWCWM